MSNSLIWISGPRCTFGIVKDNETGIVIEAAPLAKKFVGQDWQICYNWFRKKWKIDEIAFMGLK